MVYVLLVWPVVSAAETLIERGAKMGSRFEISVVHATPDGAREAMHAGWAEIDRIEAMISSWRSDSETSAINGRAGLESVRVSQELFNLIRRSLRVAQLTGGAFDITFDTVGRYWDFKDRDAPLPDRATIARALRDTGYEHVLLDVESRTVFLDRPGTRIPSSTSADRQPSSLPSRLVRRKPRGPTSPTSR